MLVPIKRVDEGLPLPAYQSPGAVAFDLSARLETTIAPGTLSRIPVNVVVRVPSGHVLIVALRSSTPERKGLVMANGIGIIDQDFCGSEDEIQIVVRNVRPAAVTVERGERLAQGLLIPLVRCEWQNYEVGDAASRGGFGSTG